MLSKMKEKIILLVEDNENDIFLTQRALAKSDVPHKLVVARDGVEALDYLFSKTIMLEIISLTLYFST